VLATPEGDFELALVVRSGETLPSIPPALHGGALGGFVVKARTSFTLFIIALATVAATASCGSSSDEGTGGPAAGAGGTAGGGILSGAGNAGKTSVGRAGSGSAGNGSNPGGSTLGAMCKVDADCDTGMVCLTPSSTELGGGGPANGMCTLTCAATTDCSAVESGADCFNFGSTASPVLYCLPACTLGGTDATTAATKCQGRGDFSCVDLSDANATGAEPFCIPLCRSDLECGTGLYCDKGSGYCSKTKPTGDPVGTACTPSVTSATGVTTPGSGNCEGFCLRLTADNETPVKGACAEFCAGLLDCMYTGDKPRHPRPGLLPAELQLHG